MQIDQTVMTFGELLNYLYRDGTQDAKYAVPTYHMYNLASNYPAGYDYTTDYTMDPEELAAGYNTSFLIDEQLSTLAADCVKVEPEDSAKYVEGWVAFQTRWNELLPDLPLYSNEYHDVFNPKLVNYEMTGVWDVSMALIYASIEE